MLDTVGVDRNLHNLVDQHKLGLSGDDAITLESFQGPSPKMFGPSNSITGLKAAHNLGLELCPMQVHGKIQELQWG